MNRQPTAIPESRAAQPPPGGLREFDDAAGTRLGAPFARSPAATSRSPEAAGGAP
ncbi:hypothetical protein ACH4MD_02870 [Streptomyces rimosus]|uniref:hypothetical protein n=1 Tax=Streptomyces TaxID=1883 RepID=UPI000AC003D1|nr:MULTISPECIES: hypothetical protein [Streptomyces]MYT47673.1 hypothetical protein [Streptomyces sp. SID5471]